MATKYTLIAYFDCGKTEPIAGKSDFDDAEDIAIKHLARWPEIETIHAVLTDTGDVVFRYSRDAGNHDLIHRRA